MDKQRRTGPTDPLFQEVIALTATIRLMRRAQGKRNPEDVPFGSTEWDEVSSEFMRDVYRAMGGDPDELVPFDV